MVNKAEKDFEKLFIYIDRIQQLLSQGRGSRSLNGANRNISLFKYIQTNKLKS